MRLSRVLPFAALPSFAMAAAPKALVYRGPAACKGCPEAVFNLLKSSPSQFDVAYVGPKEAIQLSANSLSKVDLYAQPGGGGISQTWPYMKPHKDEVRNFVSNGGVYLGACLGGYFAGTPGYDFLPKGYNTNEEIIQPRAQVKSTKNTIIQVDWKFATGQLAGTTAKNKWLFFQDGHTVLPNAPANATVLARYSSNNDVAAMVMSYGKGRIGIAGPHTEADRTWYTPYHLKNPDGIDFRYGWDLVEATYHGPAAGSK